jgi:hypothetical protein
VHEGGQLVLLGKLGEDLGEVEQEGFGLGGLFQNFGEEGHDARRPGFFFELGQLDQLHQGNQHKLLALGPDSLSKLHSHPFTEAISARTSLAVFLVLRAWIEFLSEMKMGYCGAV